MARRFSLSIPEDLADWLDAEAMKQGRTRNNLIRWILEQHRRRPRRNANEDVYVS